MEDKKWIFIEKSMEIVRYKVGNSSMEDSQEYVLCPDSSLPSTFEIIQADEEELPAEDPLEIYDDHFRCNSSSSCQTSDMEDSDIEVVLKSPSSSESASLCSRNSNKSIPNNDTCKYKDMIFNMEVGTRLNSTNDEEDSEVEVIGRSVHCDKSLEMLHAEEIDENIRRNTMTPMLDSENDDDDETEEVVDSFVTEETLCYADECELDRSRKDGEVRYVEEVEDYGIKYLFEDLHVTRQTCNRMNGVKASTVVLIVCVSATLGVYLGNYFSQSLDGDEEVVIPDHILHSNNEDPMSVNVTFKYSSSTKETLKSVLRSFRQLKQDYDRLHAAFRDLKERSHLKRQMIFYWRKQVGKVEEIGDSPINEQFSEMFNEGKTKDYIQKSIRHNSSHLHRMEIRKLSADLDRQRKSAMYWKKLYDKALLSNENTCAEDHHESPYFSFTNCLNIFSNVLPKLDIGSLNITQPVTEQVHNAWSKLTNRWNAEENRKKDDPIDATKVDRFRKIFVIGNVVNSEDLHNGYILNSTEIDVEACDNDLYSEDDFIHGGREELNIPANDKRFENERRQVNRDASPCTYTRSDESRNSSSIISRVVKFLTNDQLRVKLPFPSFENLKIGHERSENMDELRWLRNKFKESKFLVDVLKWQSNYLKKIDVVVRQRTNILITENKLKTKELEKMYDMERENMKVKEKLSNNSAYYENIRRRVKQLKVFDNRKCNVSRKVIKRILRKRYRYLINKIQYKLRRDEERKSASKAYRLLDRAKRRYNLLVTDAVKSIKREEKIKSRKKLHKMKNWFKLNNNREYEKFNFQRQNKKKDKQHYLSRTKYHDKSRGRQHRNKTLITKAAESIRRDKKSKYKKKLHKSKNSFKLNNKRDYRKFNLQHGVKKTERDYTNKNKNRKKNRDRQYKNKIRKYANKYQQSLVEITKLQKMYTDAVVEANHQQQIAKQYENEVERYKTIIKEHEEKISKLVDAKDTKGHKYYVKLLKRVATRKRPEVEGPRLQASSLKPKSRDFNTEASSKSAKVLAINVVNTEEVREETTVDNDDDSENSNNNINNNNIKTRTDVIDKVPTGNCYNDANGKSFYNINDVYPEDLFSRTAKSNTSPSIPTVVFSEPKTVHFIPHQQTNLWRTSHSHFVDLSAFNDNTMSIFGTNKSASSNGDEVRVNYKEDTAVPNNWYVRWMNEKRKHGNIDSFEDDVTEKAGIWFWKMMKERENVRSSEEEVNWFWKAMKGREKVRSMEEEVNWFWKAMKEREMLRTQEGKRTYFMRPMGSRETSRKENEE